jgi:hypothetical protein
LADPSQHQKRPRISRPTLAFVGGLAAATVCLVAWLIAFGAPQPGDSPGEVARLLTVELPLLALAIGTSIVVFSSLERSRRRALAAQSEANHALHQQAE